MLLITLWGDHRACTHKHVHWFPHSITASFPFSSSWHDPQSLSPPLSILSPAVSAPASVSTLSDIEVSGIDVIDSDEEALSPAHHCEFRQAEDVLPHLPFYHSLILNPLFYGPFPNTGDGEAGGRHVIASAPPFSLLLFFLLLHDLSIPFTPVLRHFSVLLRLFLFTICLLFSPPVSSLSLHTHYLSPPFLSLPSTSSLRAPNSCCCARMRAKFNTSVDGEEKAVLCPSAPQLFCHYIEALFFFFLYSKFSGGSRVTLDYLSTSLTETQKH